MQKEEHKVKGRRSPYQGKLMSKPCKERFFKEAWALYEKGMSIRNISIKLDKAYQFTYDTITDAMKEYRKERLSDVRRVLTEQVIRLDSISAQLQDAWDSAVKNGRKPDDKYMVGIMKALEDQRKILGVDKVSLQIDERGDGDIKISELTDDERVNSVVDMIFNAVERSKKKDINKI